MYFGYGAKDVLEANCKNLQEKIEVIMGIMYLNYVTNRA